jgi:hypothetical protein
MLVAVAGVVVRSVTGAADVNVTDGVSLAAMTAVGEAVGTRVAVSVATGVTTVGRAANVCATAVWKRSMVGPVPGVDVKLMFGIWNWQAPSSNASTKQRTTPFFLMMPSFGLRLADDLHELCHDVA